MKLALGLLAAFAALSIAVTAGWTVPLDQATVAAVAGHRTDVLNNLAINVTSFGSAPVVVLIALLVTLYALASGRQRVVLALFWTPLSFFLDNVLKLVFQHPRPTQAIIAIPDSYSFPSGHAVAASALYITLALIAAHGERRQRPRRILLWSGVAVAVLVAWSRVYLGVHYFSDVVGGLLLGGAGSVAAVRVLSRADRDQAARSLAD
ncbi:MAG TPA: phosphatase PAP2 family protein [Gemmatimonadales bacterium]|nr:phosphatase PAP2 family protein [Gemmatimonadales bacterium]